MLNQTGRELAERLKAYCRTKSGHTYDTYQFQQRIITDADGAQHEQTLFADGFVLLDVTPLIDYLAGVSEQVFETTQDVTVGHWHGAEAPGFLHVDIAAAWDKWEAEAAASKDTTENLDALNHYSYYGKALCKWFAVIGSEADGDGKPARRVLIDTKFLNLMAVDQDAIEDDFIVTMATDGRVRFENDAEGVLIGYVMPIADGAGVTSHAGQQTACPVCGGDGDYHPVQTKEEVTA